jgi:hypothetical protein
MLRLPLAFACLNYAFLIKAADAPQCAVWPFDGPMTSVIRNPRHTELLSDQPAAKAFR